VAQMAKKDGSNGAGAKLTKFEEYFYANLMVWGFLTVVAVISFFTCGAVWDDVMAGVMKFLFLVIGGGVALVSVLDFVYDQYASEPMGERTK